MAPHAEDASKTTTNEFPGFKDSEGSFTKTFHHDTYPGISPLRPEQSAAGKHIVITGGGTGIGFAVAKSFAQAGAASITITSRREPVLEAASKKILAARTNPATKVFYRAADLTDNDGSAFAGALDSVLAELGSGATFDVLVANAALFQGTTSVLEATREHMVDGLALNVLSVLNSVKGFVPRASEHPIILHTSSSAAVMASPFPQYAPYFTAKAAQSKFFDSVALELPHVSVVKVQPGIVATEMNTTGVWADTPELAGDFYTWLASSEAAFLKSRFVYVNWDVEEMKARKEEILADPLVLSHALIGAPSPGFKP